MHHSMITTNPIRLIALDLDGTLLSPDNTISPRARAAVAAARARGVHVVLATGRMHRSALPYARELGLDGALLISYNGACIRRVPDGETVLAQPLPAAVARAVAAHAEAQGYHIQAYVEDELCVPELNELALGYARHAGVPARPVGPLSRWLHQPSLKLLVITEPARLAAVQADLARHFAGQVELYPSYRSFLEVVPPGVNKGTALAAACSRLGIGPEQVLAAGDAGNDVPMLAWAGTGVAMPGAGAPVQAAACYVPSQPYGDGVAEAIARFVLR